MATIKNQKINNYAFLDSQNLNLAIKNQGWVLDFGKFRRYLADKYQVKKAFLFIRQYFIYLNGLEEKIGRNKKEGATFGRTLGVPSHGNNDTIHNL